MEHIEIVGRTQRGPPFIPRHLDRLGINVHAHRGALGMRGIEPKIPAEMAKAPGGMEQSEVADGKSDLPDAFVDRAEDRRPGPGRHARDPQRDDQQNAACESAGHGGITCLIGVVIAETANAAVIFRRHAPGRSLARLAAAY
jgi:hypothetical protein